ncbi:class I SAM-dependent methyltransferase [Nocardia sp. NPDC003482]
MDPIDTTSRPADPGSLCGQVGPIRTGDAARGRRPSLLSAGIFGAAQRFPRIRRAVWGSVYNTLATKDPTGRMLFMNLGYSDGADELELRSVDEPHRYPIQLYAHTLAGLDLTGKDVLEVGCGRGGGGSYVLRYHRPRSYVGLDLAANAIAWCRHQLRDERATWIQGSAEAIPLPAASVDVVVNVESSHTYPSVPAFFAEVFRVLRPGGAVAFADLRTPQAIPELERAMDDAGLRRESQHVISAQVLAALDRVTPLREKQIRDDVPPMLRGAFRDLVAVQNSVIYTQMATGARGYLVYRLRKPADAG